MDTIDIRIILFALGFVPYWSSHECPAYGAHVLEVKALFLSVLVHGK